MFSAILISLVLNPSALQDRLPVDVVPKVTVPNIDYVLMHEQDVVRDEKRAPYHFAVPNELSLTPKSDGLWEQLDGNKMRWACRVRCDNAISMNLGFAQYKMPTSGQMIITDQFREYQIRPFTAEDNKDHGELWTPIIPSNEVVIEITVDKSEQREVSRNIELTSINTGYRGFKGVGDRGSSGSCNIDVMCPEGDDWWDVIPSVGVYTLQGYWTCTGAMINNTAQDQTPYFLTANHCGVNSSSDSSIVVYWNHQNSYCRAPGSSASGGNGNGSYSQFTSGSTMRATRSYTDFTLTELSSQPNSSWGVTWSGWSRSSSAANGAGIHHPSTAEKRISFPDYMSASGEYWNVNWAEGTTEPGSSGSPLYDANHRIVGQLCCGAAACGNDSNDYYGRSLNQSWSYLDDYLDPTGSNVQYLDGYDPTALPLGACCIPAADACLNLREANCLAGGGLWQGEDTTCDSGICDSEPDCPTDINGDSYTNVSDLLQVIGDWGETGSNPSDVNEDGIVGVNDLLAIIDAWGVCE